MSRNPSSGEVRIDYRLDAPGMVRIALRTVLGRTVAVLRSGVMAPGSYSDTWDATLESGRSTKGVYFLSWELEGRATVRKVVVR
jgi:hypothetical protein